MIEERMAAPRNERGETVTEEVRRRLPRLQEIAKVLRESGLNVIEDAASFASLASEIQGAREYGVSLPMPIAREESGDVGIVVDKKRGIRIVFANGVFDDPDNPHRREIEKTLREKGLMEESE